MKILVTGGTGFVGRNLVRDLISRKHDVTCLVRDTEKARRLLGETPNLVLFDLRKNKKNDAPIHESDIVYHLAACVDSPYVGDFYDVNISGTRNLLNCLRRNKNLKKIVYLSSLAAAGSYSVCSEKRIPFSPYGMSKLLAERCVEEFVKERPSLRALIIRCPVVYGEGQSLLLTDFFLNIAKNKLKIPGDGSNIRKMCYLRNLITGLTDCVNYIPQENIEIINLADQERHNLKTIIDLISLEVSGRRANVKWLPFYAAGVGMLAYKALVALGINNLKLFALATTVADVDCDLKKVSDPRLFMPQYTFREGLERTILWLKESRMLGNE